MRMPEIPRIAGSVFYSFFPILCQTGRRQEICLSGPISGLTVT